MDTTIDEERAVAEVAHDEAEARERVRIAAVLAQVCDLLNGLPLKDVWLSIGTTDEALPLYGESEPCGVEGFRWRKVSATVGSVRVNVSGVHHKVEVAS